MGSNPFQYTWVLESITIHISLWKFKTSKYYVTIIEVTGHRDFIKNTLTGLAQADCVSLQLLLVLGNLKLLCLGMHRVLSMPFWLTAGVSKMDSTEPPYSQKRYQEITKEVSTHIKNTGYNPDIVVFEQISGWNNDNMLEPRANMVQGMESHPAKMTM